ncbi:MAG: MFS transporter [Planctomycetota bacterium]
MTDRYSDVPFSPRKLPFFYGWAIVLFGTVGVLMTLPGQTNGFTAFVDSLMAALGMTRERIALAYAVGTIGSSMLMPFAGRLYDRIGARYLAPLACVGLGAAALWISASDRTAAVLGRLVGAEAATPVTTFGVIALGFFVARLCGQGVLTLSCITMISEWFDRRRGLANGLRGVMMQAGMAMAVPLMLWMNRSFGWSCSYVVMAVVVGGTFSIVALLLFRNTPESCGLIPDGTPATAASASRQIEAVHRSFTVGEALRTYTFWAFALPQVVFSSFMTGLMFNLVSVFEQAGLGERALTTALLGSAWTGGAAMVLTGWVGDRIKLKYLLVVMVTSLAVSALAVALSRPEAMVPLVMVGNGITAAMFAVVPAVAWPRFFGREHLGAISGAVVGMAVFASAIGPWLFGTTLEKAGSYIPVGWTCLGILVVLFLGAWWAESPQRRFAP